MVPDTSFAGGTKKTLHRGILELRFGGHADVAANADSEPLELVIGT